MNLITLNYTEIQNLLNITPVDDQDYIFVSAAADLLNCSPQFIHSLINRGKLRVYRYGKGRIAVSLKDVSRRIKKALE